MVNHTSKELESAAYSTSRGFVVQSWLMPAYVDPGGYGTSRHQGSILNPKLHVHVEQRAGDSKCGSRLHDEVSYTILLRVLQENGIRTTCSRIQHLTRCMF